MRDVSIAQARLQLSRLVHRAEAGQVVRITRRGRAVAVLVSEAQFNRLSAPRQGLLAFTQALRTAAASTGIVLFSDADLTGLRDQSDRPLSAPA